MSGHDADCRNLHGKVNDYVDGTLNPAEAGEIERHTETCAGCREAVRQLRSLLAEASALAREADPPRDLWPPIAAAISDAEGGSPARRGATRRVALPAWGWLAAAAAVLLVAVLTMAWRDESGGMTLPQGQALPAAPASSVAARGLAGAAGLREAEEEFNDATRKLLAALEGTQGEVSPETRALLEENLRIINQAIAETTAALEKEPGNARLGRMLTAMYSRKVDLMQTAVRLPGPA